MQLPKNNTNGKAERKAESPSPRRKIKLHLKPSKKRTRTARPYPAGSFEEALKLADAIHKYAAGEKVRRLTLLQKLSLSPSSSATKMLITTSGKYGITRGSYAAEWLELTPKGKIASDPDAPVRSKLQARFELAVAGIGPFKALYDGYCAKKLPTHEVLKDFLVGSEFEVADPDECIDLFVVNAKFLGLLQMVAGAQMLLPIEQILDDLPKVGPRSVIPNATSTADDVEVGKPLEGAGSPNWQKTCFYITPIGAEDSEERRHSDLFLNHIVEPALKETGLTVVRADEIGVPGMITAQVLEYLLKARLAIVDLSFHNPNVFYELAIRHATKLPVNHMVRKSDKIPFDVNQARAITIDTTDIYSLVPQLETFRSQVATFARQALAEEVGSSSNPLTVFCPGFAVSLPSTV